MGRAIEIGQREQLISLKEAGHSLCAISQQLDLPYSTVRNLSAFYKRQGHLSMGYDKCGPLQPRCADAAGQPVAQAASPRLGRAAHPPAAGRALRGPQLAPSARTLQRWFRRAHLTKPRQQRAQPRIGQSRAVHNIWQVDAKERLTLADDSPACYLTVTDEYSGAGLAAVVFPPQQNLPGASG